MNSPSWSCASICPNSSLDLSVTRCTRFSANSCLQHRKRLQQFLLRRRQAINARGDHGLYRGGDLNRAQRPGEPHRAISSEQPFFEQRLHHFFYEERRALGAFDDEALERGEISTLSRARLIAALALSR